MEKEYTPKFRNPVNWKVNLFVISVSQFITQSAFNFCLPFLALYLREKQVAPPEDTPFWSGIFISAASVSMMIMSPIWGAYGDRHGRKVMLIRATLSGAFCIYLLGVVDSLEAMIGLRLLQGAFSGTVPVAQSLVVTETPDNRQGFALGLMMAGTSASITAGAYFGGLYASVYGAAAAFKFSGYMLFVATVMVVALVREDFHPPERPVMNTRSSRMRRRKEGMHQAGVIVPALVAVCFVAWMQSYDGPYLALYVEQLYIAQGAQGIIPADLDAVVFRMTGNINALASVIAIGGSLAISYLMDVKTPRFLWGVFGLASGAGVVLISAFDSVFGLTLGRCVFLFFISGIASIFIVLMSRMTTPEKRGAAMGWTVTARSFGWAVAPVMSAWIANMHGYAGAYFVLGVSSVPLAGLLWWMTVRYRSAFWREETPMEVVQELLPSQQLRAETENEEQPPKKSSVRLFIENKTDEIHPGK